MGISIQHSFIFFNLYGILEREIMDGKVKFKVCTTCTRTVDHGHFYNGPGKLTKMPLPDKNTARIILTTYINGSQIDRRESDRLNQEINSSDLPENNSERKTPSGFIIPAGARA
jgi:hypothetical protein